MRDEHVADRAAAVEHDPLPFSKSVAASILGKPCAGAANPVSGVTIGGAALNPAATYRITTNNFLADGGDDFQC